MLELLQESTELVRQAAIFAIFKLTYSELNRTNVLGLGGLAAVVKLLQGRHSVETRALAAECLINLTVDDDTKYQVSVATRAHNGVGVLVPGPLPEGGRLAPAGRRRMRAGVGHSQTLPGAHSNVSHVSTTRPLDIGGQLYVKQRPCWLHAVVQG